MMGLRRVGILIFVLIVIGCSGKSAETEAVHGQRSAASGAAQTLDQLTLNLPIGPVPEDVAAYANGSLRVQDRASVVNKSDGPAKVVNAGQSLTRIGVSALTGDLWSRASVDLARDSTIAGDLTTASGATQATGATVTGSLNTNVSLELESTKWTPSLPTGNSGDVQLEPNEIQQIGPAAYGQVVVKMGATLRLQSGVFLLDRLLIEPSAKLELLSGEPTVLYVKNELIFRGSVVNATDPDATRVQLLVVPIGTAGAVVEAPFKGTIFAPNGPVTLSGGTHHGAFFGQDFELAPDSKVVHRPFRWTTVLPPRTVVWREAPVIVGAWRDFHTGAQKVGDVTPASPVDFEIPNVVPVRTGNAGNGTLDFRFRVPSGELVVCSYRGGANVPSPSTDLERMLGLRYLLESCTGGYVGGQRVVGTWFGLNVISADPATLSGRTAVALHLGGGCSDFLPPPIAPAEVVALRENFTYADVDSLPELDPTGRPALWHGLIYIEEKSQLQALDRMRIFWSARPLSKAYNDTLEGKCGRLEHATDGRGVIVYAVFPARFFNIFRDFGVQAENAGIAPPFKFIIPSSPDEPEFALTQIKDSYDYSRTVIGHEPHRMEVLTGWVANNITKALNGGDPRAMCLCLDFPSVGTTALTAAAAAAGAGAGGLAGGPPGAVVGAIVGAVSSSILQKDLWWPDSDDYHLQYTSRGVMTHEYGHFNMCSMLYTEDGPNALRGLIQRIFDGDDSRDDDMAIMLEAVADTFSMQVAGGANYLRPLGSYANFNRELVMGFCVEAPCMDFNYGGGGEYQPDSDFHDELARYVSLIHDVFDRADGNNRLAAQPWNGDVWRDFSTQGLTFSPTGYIAHDDEPVSLPGSAWKDWIVKWLERGRNPTLSNILGGLVDTMEQHEVNWCDRCEVFAAHHQATPPVARMLNPADSSSSIRTFDIRHQRWETCAADAWLEDWVGGVPERFLNLDNACNACAPLEFVNSSGVCTPCPPGEVPRGRSCIPCPNGTVPTPGNVCTSCEDNEIVVGNACVACPLGTGPDPARTTCVDCPADVVVDWAGVPMSCPDLAEVAVSQSAHPADACPWEFWVEVVGLDELVSRGGTALTGVVSRWAEQWPNPGQNNCLGSSAGIDFVAKTASGAWTVLAGSVDQGSWVPAGCVGDICLPAHCSLEAKSALPAASFPADNRVRIRSSPQLHGNATPGHLWLWNNVVYPECEVH